MDKAGISETSEPARINRTPTTMLTGMASCRKNQGQHGREGGLEEEDQ